MADKERYEMEVMALEDEIDRLLDERDDINGTLREYRRRRKLAIGLLERMAR